MDGNGSECEVTNSVFHPRASVASDCQPCHDAAMKADLPIEVDPEIMSGAPVFAGTAGLTTSTRGSAQTDPTGVKLLIGSKGSDA